MPNLMVAIKERNLYLIPLNPCLPKSFFIVENEEHYVLGTRVQGMMNMYQMQDV